MSTARIQNKGQVTIPTAIRRQTGLSKGDVVDIAVRGIKIVITPKVVIDRSQFANADEEIKAGRVHGPFTAKEATAYIERLAKERTAAKKTKRSRR